MSRDPFDDMTPTEAQMYADIEDPPTKVNSAIVEAVDCPACKAPRGTRCVGRWDHDARIFRAAFLGASE